MSRQKHTVPEGAEEEELIEDLLIYGKRIKNKEWGKFQYPTTGFVPTSYSSSRTARAESRKSRPEDYMDEQDLSKHYSLAAAAGFKHRTDGEQDTSAEGQLFRMVQEKQDDIGMHILKALGFKKTTKATKFDPSQLSAAPGHDARGAPVYGVSAPDDDADVSTKTRDDEWDSMFANMTMKTDFYGLGYSQGVALRGVLGSGAELKRSLTGDLAYVPAVVSQSSKDTKSKPAPGALPRLHDEDDDDDEGMDIYGTGRSKTSYYAFDESFKNEYDIDALMGRAKSKTSGPSVSRRQETSSAIVPQQYDNAIAFIETSDKVTVMPNIPHVRIPHGWRPLANMSDRGDTSHDSDRHHYRKLTVDDRSRMLGESNRKHVEDDIIKQQKQRIVDALTLADAGGQSVFIPFENDPDKRGRYLAFLHNNLEYSLSGLEPGAARAEEQEFIEAVRVFQPMSSTFAKRFVSEGKFSNDRSDDNQKKTDKKTQQAADAGMHGGLTRVISVFVPDKMLLRRFNVADPFAGRNPSMLTEEQQYDDRDAGPSRHHSDSKRRY